MTHAFLAIGTAASLLLLGATGGSAQTVLTGIDSVDDRIDDIDREARLDLDRGNDAFRYGSPEYRDGLSGSASLGYSGKTGVTDSSEFSLGARLRLANGPMIQTLGVVLDFAESGSVKTKEDLFAIYDANYYFDDNFYGFALGRVKTDGLAETAGAVKTDAFVGVGPGYRVINTPDLSWRLQAGIGVSYLKDGTGTSDTETGYIASSRLFWRLSETLFATNDTDVLKSDSALRVNNDLGFNVKMSDMFATRVSYLTEYNDSRAVRTENKLGVSLVYSF
jgi:putative salt-induced outer membrane protein